MKVFRTEEHILAFSSMLLSTASYYQMLVMLFRNAFR